ncbi:MAG: hypothetical protein ACRCU2_28635 [Planktothrix sp.]
MAKKTGDAGGNLGGDRPSYPGPTDNGIIKVRGEKLSPNQAILPNKLNGSPEITVYHDSSDCQKMPETLANSLRIRLLNLWQLPDAV